MSSCSWCYPYQSQKSPGVIDLVGLGFLRRVRAVKRCNRRAVYKPHPRAIAFNHSTANVYQQRFNPCPFQRDGRGPCTNRCERLCVLAVHACNYSKQYKSQSLNYRVMADIYHGLGGMPFVTGWGGGCGHALHQKTAELAGMPRTGPGRRGFVFQGVFVPP